MSGSGAENDRLWYLADAVCAGMASKDELTELAALLLADEQVRSLYIAYCQLHASIGFELRGRRAGMLARDKTRREMVTQSDDDSSARPFATDAASAPLASSPPFFPGVSVTEPAVAVGFSRGWPVAYLVATVVVGLGLVIGNLLHVSQSTPVAGPSDVSRSPPAPSLLPRMQFVGRITGMVDCDFSDASTVASAGSSVPVGRKFALSSGLLEITYDTGAKVILQGPVTYEVESRDGGYLSVGKLTARMENKEERKEEREESGRKNGNRDQSQQALTLALSQGERGPDKHSSFLIPHSYFAVRTPTATVTDLGTEFGVEVSEPGVTEMQVFQGKVKVAGRGQAGDVPERTLLEGQAMRVTPGATGASVFVSNQQRFVRRMPTQSHELIAEVDYSDTWTSNSPTRAGSRLRLDAPGAAQVEQCHGNPSRSWVFSQETAMTTWPGDNSPVPWPGHKAPGSRSGFSETICGYEGYFGFEYGLRDDFVVQFDAVQTDDRINITVGDKPAAVDGAQSFSVFFHVSGLQSSVIGPSPDIGVFSPLKCETDSGLRSGIDGPWQWHNYAVRFNLREKRLTVWVDRQCRGTIDLASITREMGPSGNDSWASLPWTNRYITIGGYSRNGATRVWTDNFRVGSPRELER